MNTILGANWRTTLSGWIAVIASAFAINPGLIAFLPDAARNYVTGMAGIVAVLSGGTFATQAKDKRVTGGNVANDAGPSANNTPTRLIAPLIIAALILWTSLGIVRESLNILLEGTPRGISLAAIRSGMEEVEGVMNVHDLHVWSLGSNSSALACHVTIADIPPSESACILLKLNHVLKEHFHIAHATIQFEHLGCEELEGCVVPIEEMIDCQSHEHHHGHAH